jgi:hypothetical protein
LSTSTFGVQASFSFDGSLAKIRLGSGLLVEIAVHYLKEADQFNFSVTMSAIGCPSLFSDVTLTAWYPALAITAFSVAASREIVACRCRVEVQSVIFSAFVIAPVFGSVLSRSPIQNKSKTAEQKHATSFHSGHYFNESAS